MGNVERAARLIAAVRAAGADEFCVCAGSRNSPLLAVLGASDLRLYSFVDERSAAFFALGRIKLRARPVAVVTTSGTAVAEMLPAAIEAHYSGLPLVLISADRPAAFRGTGAPQSIDQIGLFGPYAATSLDDWTGDHPLHLNIEFGEPLLDEADVPTPARRVSFRAAEAAEQRRTVEESPSDGGSLAALRRLGMTRSMRRPLVILGSLAPRHRARAKAFAMRLGAPVYAEPLSGLREDGDLPLITAGERMIGRGAFDGVIRIGNVPTLRFWRDLEEMDLPVVHYSALPFAGLTRGEVYPIEALPEEMPAIERDDDFFANDREQAKRFAAILEEEPESELAMLRRLSREVPDRARVYLGNSLPIREWDLAATREPRGLTIEANRGANGIDGQISTFFGQSDPSRDNICVVGDLTAIYDLGAPWIVPQLGHSRFRIVIVNNGGGRIFSRVASLRRIDDSFRERIIENAHGITFEHWAAMWKIEITELVPDARASKRAWQRYDALWA